LNGSGVEIFWDDSVLFLKIQLNHVPLLFDAVQLGLELTVDCAIAVSVLLHSPLEVPHQSGFGSNAVQLEANAFTTRSTRL